MRRVALVLTSSDAPRGCRPRQRAGLSGYQAGGDTDGQLRRTPDQRNDKCLAMSAPRGTRLASAARITGSSIGTTESMARLVRSGAR